VPLTRSKIGRRKKASNVPHKSGIRRYRKPPRRAHRTFGSAESAFALLLTRVTEQSLILFVIKRLTTFAASQRCSDLQFAFLSYTRFRHNHVAEQKLKN
jgi:hypothetical protein